MPAASCIACGGPLVSAADRREGLCQRHRSCHTCGREVDGNSVLCAEHRRERRERRAAHRRATKEPDRKRRWISGRRPATQTGATRGRAAAAQRPKQRQQGSGRTHFPGPPRQPHEVALDGLGASARLDEASRLILGLPVTASQDQRFALIDRLTGRSPTLLSAYAAQPGCPPEVRYLALLEAGSDLIDEHCRLYGDDRRAVLSALWDRLAAER